MTAWLLGGRSAYLNLAMLQYINILHCYWNWRIFTFPYYSQDFQVINSPTRGEGEEEEEKGMEADCKKDPTLLDICNGLVVVKFWLANLMPLIFILCECQSCRKVCISLLISGCLLTFDICEQTSNNGLCYRLSLHSFLPPLPLPLPFMLLFMTHDTRPFSASNNWEFKSLCTKLSHLVLDPVVRNQC